MMIPPYFSIIYSELDRVVQRYGWALTLHGSMSRDLDVVLIPWLDNAEHEDKVIDAIRFFVEGKYIISRRKYNEKKTKCSTKDGLAYFHVTQKPHGRRAIALYIGVSQYYIDISIIPREEYRKLMLSTEQRLKALGFSLCSEPNGEWSLSDHENEKAYFGKTIEEALAEAEKQKEIKI